LRRKIEIRNNMNKSAIIAMNDPIMMLVLDRNRSMDAPVLMMDATKRNAEAMKKMYQIQINFRMKRGLASYMYFTHFSNYRKRLVKGCMYTEPGVCISTRLYA